MLSFSLAFSSALMCPFSNERCTCFKLCAAGLIHLGGLGYLLSLCVLRKRRLSFTFTLLCELNALVNLVPFGVGCSGASISSLLNISSNSSASSIESLAMLNIEPKALSA